MGEIIYQRVTDAALPNWLTFQIAGRKITYQDMYDMQKALKNAINKNFTDIKNMYSGGLASGNAAYLREMAPSLYANEVLQPNDTTIPSSKQVYEAVLGAIVVPEQISVEQPAEDYRGQYWSRIIKTL